MSDVIDIDQRSDEWFAARAGCATSSRVAELTARTKSGWGAGRKNMIATLVRERLTGACAQTFQNAAMAWGVEHEPMARMAYELFYGVDVREVGFMRHPDMDWCGASPDGLVGGDGMVEIKCPSEAAHMETLEGSPIPANYIKQMQWQMDCAGREWCDFVSFDPRWPVPMQLHVRCVERDEEMIKALRADVQSALDEVSKRLNDLKGKYLR